MNINLGELFKELYKIEEKYGVTIVDADLSNKLVRQVSTNKCNTLPYKADSNKPAWMNSRLQLIKSLEDETGVLFTSNNFIDYMDYINQAKQFITLKQLDFINRICNALGMNCYARNRQEASKFIEDYKKMYYQLSRITRDALTYQRR